MLVVLLTASCATTTVNQTSRPSAPMIATQQSADCKVVEGTYDDRGSPIHTEIVNRPRLARSLFRLPLRTPSGDIVEPKYDRLVLDEVAGNLTVSMISGGVQQEWSTPYSCENGWVHVIDSQGQVDIGNGVVQRWYRADLFLAVAIDGRLVARIVGAGEDEIRGQRHSSSAEDWYVFERVAEPAL